MKQSALGDTLLLLPVIKAIRDEIGLKGRLDMLVTPVNETVAARCPWLDEVHLFDPPASMRDPGSVLRLIGSLRRRKYSCALDFDQWLRSSALLAVVSGARRTAGFRTRGQHRHFAYDDFVVQEKGVHESALFSRLAEEAGVASGKIEPYAGFLRKHDIFSTSGSSAPKAQKMVLFHPGCGAHGWQREWPVERYAELGERLVRDAGVSIVVTGHGDHERMLVDELSRIAAFEFDDLAGNLTFEGLARRVAGAGLVVCGNTGIMHLAVGMDVPVVALHGPTDSSKWGPGRKDGKAVVVRSPLDCSPCLFLGSEYGCESRPCMESIGVEEVYDLCIGLIRTGGVR